MKLKPKSVNVSLALMCFAFLSSACSYPIKYRLNEQTVVKANATLPMKVQVATFEDRRDETEREKGARKTRGDADAGDYTYDREFTGDVSASISVMMVKHLDYSRVFESVSPCAYSSAQITNAVLDELAQNGVDAVLAGELQHFYGYYDNNPGKQMGLALLLGIGLSIPVALATTGESNSGVPTTNSFAISLAASGGTYLGLYIESTSKRRIDRHLKFTARLISTTTHEVLWWDVVEVRKDEHAAMPGLNTSKRKYQVAIRALREAVNDMVTKLEKAQFSISEKND